MLPNVIWPLRRFVVLGLLALGVAVTIPACGGESPGAAYPTPGTAEPADLPPGCDAWNGQPIEVACVPRAAREGMPLLFEAVASCGACGARADACTVTRDGRTLILSLDGMNCPPGAAGQCRSECTQKKLPCRIPALEGGRYIVRWNDPAGRVDAFDVVPDGDARTSCMLEQ